MRSIAKLAALTIFLIAGNELSAQEKKLVLSGENIQTGIQEYEYIRDANGEETVIGKITETIEHRQDSMLIVYKQEVPRMVITDSLFVDFESFNPIAYTSKMPPRETITVNYTGNEKADIRVKRRSFGVNQDTTFVANFERPRYDAHWIPTLVYASHGQNSDSWRIPVYSSNYNKDILSIENMGKETLRFNDRDFKTTKYEIKRDSDDSVYYYWIGNDSKRLIQTRGNIEPGLVVWLRIKSQI